MVEEPPATHTDKVDAPGVACAFNMAFCLVFHRPGSVPRFRRYCRLDLLSPVII